MAATATLSLNVPRVTAKPYHNRNLAKLIEQIKIALINIPIYHVLYYLVSLSSDERDTN